MIKVSIENKDDFEMKKSILSPVSLPIEAKWSPVVCLSRKVVDTYREQQKTSPRMKTPIAALDWKWDADILGRLTFNLTLEEK